MTDQLPTPPPTQTEIPKDASEIPADPTAAVVTPGAFLLELVPVPVTDVDRAKRFYSEQAGFHVDVDVSPADGVRIVQLTPPGSYCSITLVTGLPQLDMPPGTLRGLHLVVKDIEAAPRGADQARRRRQRDRRPRRRLLRLVRGPRRQHLGPPAHALAPLTYGPLGDLFR